MGIDQRERLDIRQMLSVGNSEWKKWTENNLGR